MFVEYEWLSHEWAKEITTGCVKTMARNVTVLV